MSHCETSICAVKETYALLAQLKVRLTNRYWHTEHTYVDYLYNDLLHKLDGCRLLVINHVDDEEDAYAYMIITFLQRDIQFCIDTKEMLRIHIYTAVNSALYRTAKMLKIMVDDMV